LRDMAHAEARQIGHAAERGAFLGGMRDRAAELLRQGGDRGPT
jgi:hypothetical protein